MFKKQRVGMMVLALLLIALVLPTVAFASKGVYRARLSSVVEDSTARGTVLFGRIPDGLQFAVTMRNLSSPVTGIHVHGPATEDETGPLIITLCGEPTPAVLETCDVDELLMMGEFTSNALALPEGANKHDFLDWLEGGLLYVQVDTELHPDGEARGQMYRVR